MPAWQDAACDLGESRWLEESSEYEMLKNFPRWTSSGPPSPVRQPVGRDGADVLLVPHLPYSRLTRGECQAT